MIKKIVIPILYIIVFFACQDKREEFYESSQSTDLLPINLTMKLNTGIEMQEGGYFPMSTRGNDEKKFRIDRLGKCLIMKEIENNWYIDASLTPVLSDKFNKYQPNYFVENINLDPIQLELRPGNYRVLMVLNPERVKWNKNLVPGALVKNAAGDSVAIAYRYNYETQSGFENTDERMLGGEIFVGTADFTVKKSEDLHSLQVVGNTEIELSRKVTRIRVLLKDSVPSKGYAINFKGNTMNCIYFTVKATGAPSFCDGLDCWGNAYYLDPPTREIPMIITCDEGFKSDKYGTSRYMICIEGAHIYSPYLLVDDKVKEIPCEFTDIRVTGQSGYPDGYKVSYNRSIPGYFIRPNSITGFALRMDSVWPGENQYEGIMEYLPEVDVKDVFLPFDEWNFK